jgi:iron complex transport system substrate-binding protein
VSEQDVRALGARLKPTPRIVSVSGSTLDGVFADIATVAEALGVGGDAERLLSALRARMKRIHVALAAARAPRPTVAVLEWTDPVFAAGHWVPEMIHRAGGSDVLAVPGQSSREVTWETLADASPDLILVAPCGYDLDRAVLEARELVERRPGRVSRAVWALDARQLVSQPGPGLVTGIETMAAILHGGLFGAPLASRAVRVA